MITAIRANPSLNKPRGKGKKKEAKILILISMTSPSPGHRRKFSSEASLSSGLKLQNLPPEKHSGIVRRFVSTLTPKLPWPARPNSDESILRPSKLLVNVTMENSLGAIQVLMLPEDTVGDLIKAALVFYEMEKRRPLLKNIEPKCYDLHYSQFTFQSNNLSPSLLFWAEILLFIHAHCTAFSFSFS